MAADIGALTTWSTTASSNQPDTSDSISNLDDNLQQIQAEVRKYLGTKGADIASAATVDLATATGNYVHITGVTTITALGTVAAGIRMLLVFDGALTFTHNATSLILPGAANITTAAGDRCEVVSLGSGNWRCLWYQKVSGEAVTLTLDPTLAAIAALDATAGLVEQTGVDTFTKRPISANIKSFLDAADNAAARTALDLATVTQAEAEAGTATTTRAWTAERVKQAITTLAPTPTTLPAGYVSADSAMTLGGLISLTHELGAAPRLIQMFLVCSVADAGYSVGDALSMEWGEDAGIRGPSAIIENGNTTQIYVRIGGTNPFIPNKTTGAQAAITLASWKLRVRAWA